jgi:hypothetical protein
MTNKSQSLDDLFAQEEDAARAKHEEWLADPVAQEEHRAKVQAEIERAEAQPDDDFDPLTDTSNDDYDHQDDDCSDAYDADEF